MSTPAWSAVLFDIDDVIYPMMQYATSGFKAVSDFIKRVHGVEILADLINAHDRGNPITTIETALRHKFGSLDTRLQAMITYVFACHQPTITMYSDAKSCVALANSLRIRTGIAAGGNPGTQKMKMKALKADQLMDSIIYAGDLAGTNKMTDAITMSCMLLDADPARTIYVANQYSDNLKEIMDIGVKLVIINRENRPVHIDTPFAQGNIPVIDSLLNILDITSEKHDRETCLARTA